MGALQKIRSVADYQFGRGVGAKLFPDVVYIVYSKNTGKIRHIHLNEELLATLRPTTGLFILTIAGAKWLIHEVNPLRYWVKVNDEAEPFVSKGRSAFAKHVTAADTEIRPNNEVTVINRRPGRSREPRGRGRRSCPRQTCAGQGVAGRGLGTRNRRQARGHRIR